MYMQTCIFLKSHLYTGSIITVSTNAVTTPPANAVTTHAVTTTPANAVTVMLIIAVCMYLAMTWTSTLRSSTVSTLA